ncbi:MAG: DNA polymerase III subunit delta' [Candidatus Thiodiazotropha taylori]|nr:DNA polymerase III subunit delta' [Candidatus Thiodiazotropha taylori]MCG7909074.1 DNA polymerase III subunit delta' [Candidatus Thiodiazotropha taylori]MCG8067252.1 DNA polymerase III subunit delta' [Candidatus Thiodiazotropha taylori]
MVETGYSPMPWHQQQWQQLQQSLNQGRLSHALLLSGPPGLGKQQFALSFAQSLLCSNPSESGQACGTCQHCHLIQAGNHPDLQWIGPEEGSKSGEIKIDAIRALTSSAALTAHSAKYKVIGIQPAHRMTNGAANSLLKTLEEPTSGTLILLLTDQPARLLPTIRSRCQSVVFHPPQRTQALAWLSGKVEHADPALLLGLANGAPLKALALNDKTLLESRSEMLNQFLALSDQRLDPVKLAGIWQKFDYKLLIEWLIGWIIDLQRLKLSSSGAALSNPDRAQALQKTADKLNSRAIQSYLKKLYAVRALTDSNINLQLTLEKLLIEWQACSRQGA